jgi:hypothetical protein
VAAKGFRPHRVSAREEAGDEDLRGEDAGEEKGDGVETSGEKAGGEEALDLGGSAGIPVSSGSRRSRLTAQATDHRSAAPDPFRLSRE